MVVVPTILERSNDKEYMYDLYSCLLKKRIILLNGEIDDTMSSSICAQLLYLSSLSKDPIQIYINSNGEVFPQGLLFMISCNIYHVKSLLSAWVYALAWLL